jgi:hypothetical protein
MRRAGGADQGDGHDPVAVDLEPLLGQPVCGTRGAERPAGFPRRLAPVFQGRRDLVVSMLNQAKASAARSPKARSTSIPTSRAASARPRPRGTVIANDEVFRHRPAGGNRRCRGLRRGLRRVAPTSASATPPATRSCARPARASSGSARLASDGRASGLTKPPRS